MVWIGFVAFLFRLGRFGHGSRDKPGSAPVFSLRLALERVEA
ncbi:hypothetical protein B481_0579 [Planococcus halocryophilus Or1]|nr:hypothetical protein B481_0579 [Planococcus halocryophilus Or1]